MADIKNGRLFPVPFLVLAALFTMAAIGLFSANPILSIILLLLGGLILTAYEGTEIDPAVRRYREYYSFFFLLKKGSWNTYNGIEKIFINSGKVSQKVYTAHTTSSATFTDVEYNAYLKFDDGVKAFLASDRNKDRLLRRLATINERLKTSIVDHTVQNRLD